MIEKNGFKIYEIVQTLTNIKAREVEQPMKGFGKGSFVVVDAKKCN